MVIHKPVVEGHPDRYPRARQADRLACILTVLRLIQSRGQWNAKAIAQELVVTERRVYRDLQALEFAALSHHLTVEDEGDRLSVNFGPIPLFRRSVKYENIVKVETGRTTILDGWGIHMSLRGGWVWNLWGRNCVVLRLRKEYPTSRD